MEEEKQTEGNYALSRFRLGFTRMHHLYREKMKEYA